MYDRFNRRISYLRISVTDRCNLRCTYCMPEEGIRLLDHREILGYDEIRDFTVEAVEAGITKVRLTGGEPLVRRGIETLVSMLAEIDGILDLSMTTNGVLLRQYAHRLKESGLQRVNVSLDTVDPLRFAELTRRGRLEDVLDGIMAAREAGLNPVKINCVVKEGPDEEMAAGVAKFCSDNGFEIRYITQMDLVRGHFSTVTGGTGGNCALCNRLRLTSDGKLKPCLFSDLEWDIRKLGYREALRLAVESKPECGSSNTTGEFYNIGG